MTQRRRAMSYQSVGVHGRWIIVLHSVDEILEMIAVSDKGSDDVALQVKRHDLPIATCANEVTVFTVEDDVGICCPVVESCQTAHLANELLLAVVIDGDE